MSGVLDGRRYLAHLGSAGVSLPELGSVVVMALHPGARPLRARTIDGPFGAVDQGRGRNKAITISPLGPGAAVVAMTVEMLHALGVRTIFAVGVASAIQRCAEGRSHGSVVVIDNAVANDAVSAAYSADARADAALTDELCVALEAERGQAFSTSIPFRLDLEAVMGSSADVVDMEAAALFSAATAFGVAAALAVVISDTTTANEWIPGDPATLRPAVRAVGDMARELVEGRR